MVRGLLSEYSEGHGPPRLTMLANRFVAAAYADYARGPVSLHEVGSYRPGDGNLTRAAAMAAARVLPRRAARDVPPGLDVLHYPVTVPIPATGAPTVVTIHDLQHRDLSGFFSRAERAYRRWAYDGAARGATLVVATSEFTKRRVVEVLGVPAERVEPVYHGIDHDRFVPEGKASAPVGGPFLVYPANLWPHKNHERLLEAFAAAPESELSLVLTGQAYGRLDSLLERARALGVADRVQHLGHVPHDDMPALLRAATAMVFPSLYEGFGAPPVEAMACGCPVAASTSGSLPEVCADAALGFDAESVEEMSAAIERVATDEQLRGRLRDAGLRRAKSFTWSAAAERHRSIYERAAATSG
jgi:glycosyltransferase involved in cell wall biosynthesis